MQGKGRGERGGEERGERTEERGEERRRGSSTGKRGPLVLQTLYAPVQGNANAKKQEWVGRGAGWRNGIRNFQNSI
jgi:hypothetical protein